jgi:hypothetical protein
VTVLVRQTVTATIKAEPLGPLYRVTAEPATAALSINGVDVGPGVFEGRLPLAGKHAAEAREEGYFTEAVALDPAKPAVTIKLLVDETHPRWRQASRGKLRVEPFLGLVLGAGFGSGPESSCTGCTSEAAKLPAQGGIGGARLQYEFPAGLRLGVGGGYLKAQHVFERSVTDGTTGYTIADKLQIAGPFAMLGLAYPWPRLAENWRGVARLDLGMLFASVRDPASGQATRGSEPATAVNFENSGKVTRGVTAFAMPGVGAEYTSGKFSLGLGLAAAIFLLDGPALGNGELGPEKAAACPSSAPLACARGTTAFAGERAFSRFILWVPQITAGLEFLALLLVQGGPRHDRSFSRSPGRRPRPGGLRPPRGGGLGRALFAGL